MHFANPIPWWAAIAVAAAIGGLAYASYRRPLAPLSATERAALIALRALSLAAIVIFICRPTRLVPPNIESGVVVPILVDVSRSMSIADANGNTRIARATELVHQSLLPALSKDFKAEIYAVGESWTPASADRLGSEARQSNLTRALSGIRERYRGRPVSGIILLSDGGETGTGSDPELPRDRGQTPIFAVGIGSAEGPKDREVLGMSIGDPRLDQASVDLHVTAVSHGFGRTPMQLRLLANGVVVESRSVAPAADGSPIDEAFTVSPDATLATVYTAEIAADPEETIAQNNARSVLASPAGRKRRVLALAGAPGYEFSFLARALAKDPGLEVDSVVRKGQNENGQSTFLVQAGGGRAAALTSGFPPSREALYAYDGLIVANVEGDYFTRAQLGMAADFVSARGGGLLVLGGRSFAQRGLIGTPLEPVLPLELNDRRGVVRAAIDTEGSSSGPPNTVTLTAEGERHPIMRVAADARKTWATLPPLAASATLGGPRPGASVLAVTVAPSGGLYPLVAVQRYGSGRSMIFAGEASWRWRMMVPASDRTYEYFWRQAARWLAAPAPDPVAVAVTESAEPGDAVQIAIDARDSEFAGVPDATVQATVSAPGGAIQPLALRPDAATRGRFAATIRPDQAGLYRVQVEARRGARPLGAADRWFYVGGSDREFADPRLNDGFLGRIARDSGGQYVTAADAANIVPLLRAAVPQNVEPERRDLWHGPWAFALVVALLSTEWILRRRWGLR
jgi:uncharacterized membrane protein